MVTGVFRRRPFPCMVTINESLELSGVIEMPSSDPSTLRPLVMGSRYMASTGHPLATAAAVRILEAGGNAFDAGVAAGLALNVVQPEFTNLGGVAPTILYSAELRRSPHDQRTRPLAEIDDSGNRGELGWRAP
ncbi:MAG: gamma-glutamyltransferase [Thermomicrobiales bacterium]